MNSFLALYREDIVEFTEQRQDVVREKVVKQLRTAELVGDMIELFLPVMADTFTVLGGGQPLTNEGHYLTLPLREEGEDDFPFGGEDLPPPGPGSRNEIIR